MIKKNILILTQTPLHVGAGTSIGPIDLMVQREGHTQLPIIPASGLKGSFADYWLSHLKDSDDQIVRVRTNKAEEGKDSYTVSQAAWLFGSDNTDCSFAGSLLFQEARLLVFPVRSAKGSYVWITSPSILRKAKREGILTQEIPNEPDDSQAVFFDENPANLKGKVVIEEFTLQQVKQDEDKEKVKLLSKEISELCNDDFFQGVIKRLVVVSDGMMSYFAQFSCEIAQHNRICDKTGVAEDGGLFNQENIPSDTLFYTSLRSVNSRVPTSVCATYAQKSEKDSLDEFQEKVEEEKVLQFGANASTGLGRCTVYIAK